MRRSTLFALLVVVGRATEFETYEARVKALKEFILKEGHSDVPRDSALGEWLARIRHAGRTGKLPDVKRKDLEKIGATMTPLAGRWEEGYRLLDKFVKRQGVDIPRRHIEDGVNLWAWLHQQRRDARSGSLAPEKKQKLAKLGVLAATPWDRHIKALDGYVKREGHGTVPRSHVEGDVKLGAWLAKQKSRAQNNKLHPDQKKALERLGVRLTEPTAKRLGPSKQPQHQKKKKSWKLRGA